MQANSPSEVYDLFGQYFSAGTIDLLLTMYEDGAVMTPAPGQLAVGKDVIRGVLNAFLALNGDFHMEDPTILRSGDIALLMARWTLKGTAPAGRPVELAGQTSDVIRQQADGSWLFAVDNPYGSANVA